MELEILSPGMQYSGYTRHRAKIFPVRTQLQYRFGSRLKQQCVQDALVTEKNRISFRRDSKNDMEIGNVQKMLPLSIDPLLFRNGLAFRAVAVAAGIVGDFCITTVVTSVYVCAQSGCPAIHNALCSFLLNKIQRMAFRIGSHVGGKNILNLNTHCSQCGQRDLRDLLQYLPDADRP